MREWEKIKLRVRNINTTEGEKASKFFFNLTNQQMHHNRMIKLQDESGNDVDQPSSILKRVNELYEDLYTSEEISEKQPHQIPSGINTESFHEDIVHDLEKTRMSTDTPFIKWKLINRLVLTGWRLNVTAPFGIFWNKI